MNGYCRFQNGTYDPADIPTIFKRKLVEHWDSKRPSGSTTSLSSAERRKYLPGNYIGTHQFRERRLPNNQEKQNSTKKKQYRHTKSQDEIRPNKDHPILAKIIPNLSDKTDNMRQLLKKGTKLNWTTERNSNFNKIKQELTNLSCLAHYNRNKEMIVTTDVCETGLVVALWQKQRNGVQTPIAFASRYLNDAEKKCSIGELEVLAGLWGLERFRFHLYGKQVLLFSGHQAHEPLLKKTM